MERHCVDSVLKKGALGNPREAECTCSVMTEMDVTHAQGLGLCVILVLCFRFSAGPVLNHPTCIPDHSFASQGTIASYHQYIIGLYCLRRFYYNAILNLYIKKNQKASLHL